MYLLNSTLPNSFKIEESIRFYPKPQGESD